MNNMHNNTIAARTRDHHANVTVGKYLISPLVRPADDGHYACSVSIRSGSGSATTDRVVRLTQLFRDRIAATEHAVNEGLRWVGGAVSAPRAPA